MALLSPDEIAAALSSLSDGDDPVAASTVALAAELLNRAFDRGITAASREDHLAIYDAYEASHRYATYGRMRALAAADQAKAGKVHGMTMADYVAERRRVPRPAGLTAVLDSRSAIAHPNALAAAAAGHMNERNFKPCIETLSEIAEVVTPEQLPDIEADVLAAATTPIPENFRRRTRELIRRANRKTARKQDEVERINRTRSYAQRSASLILVDDGRAGARMSVRFTAEQHDAVLPVIEYFAERQRQALKSAGLPTGTTATRRADALAWIVANFFTDDPAWKNRFPTPPDPRTPDAPNPYPAPPPHLDPAATLVEAPGRMSFLSRSHARRVRAAPVESCAFAPLPYDDAVAAPGPIASNSPRRSFHPTARSATLTVATAKAAVTAALASYGAAAPATPHDLGRTARGPSPDLRLMVRLRDGGCIHPNCTAEPYRCEIHHLHSFADGGPTSFFNLVLVCRAHHLLLQHEPGSRTHWTARIGPDGLPEVIPPVSIDPQQTPRRHERFTPDDDRLGRWFRGKIPDDESDNPDDDVESPVAREWPDDGIGESARAS